MERNNGMQRRGFLRRRMALNRIGGMGRQRPNRVTKKMAKKALPKKQPKTTAQPPMEETHAFMNSYSEIPSNSEVPSHSEVPSYSEVPSHSEVPSYSEVPSHSEVPMAIKMEPKSPVNVKREPLSPPYEHSIENDEPFEIQKVVNIKIEPQDQSENELADQDYLSQSNVEQFDYPQEMEEPNMPSNDYYYGYHHQFLQGGQYDHLIQTEEFVEAPYTYEYGQQLGQQQRGSYDHLIQMEEYMEAPCTVEYGQQFGQQFGQQLGQQVGQQVGQQQMGTSIVKVEPVENNYYSDNNYYVQNESDLNEDGSMTELYQGDNPHFLWPQLGQNDMSHYGDYDRYDEEAQATLPTSNRFPPSASFGSAEAAAAAAAAEAMATVSSEEDDIE